MTMTERTMRDLVLENTNVASIFEKYELDYCCHGNIKLADACKKKFIDTTKVTREIEETGRSGSLQHISQWRIPFLIQYIIENHHRYVKEAIPAISLHLSKCVESHDTRYPMLAEVQSIFSRMASELQTHMMKEEKILFPSIILMVDCLEKNQPMGSMPFDAIAYPIGMMRFEHEIAGNEMIKIHEMLNDLTPSDDACTTMKLVYKELGEFEQDLHRHVFLENFVLFPKAEKLERDLLVAAGD